MTASTFLDVQEEARQIQDAIQSEATNKEIVARDVIRLREDAQDVLKELQIVLVNHWTLTFCMHSLFSFESLPPYHLFQKEPQAHDKKYLLRPDGFCCL